MTKTAIDAAVEGREALMDVTASLAAAISLLERSPKTAAPSNKMFDTMLNDYRASLERARAALSPTVTETAAEDASELEALREYKRVHKLVYDKAKRTIVASPSPVPEVDRIAAADKILAEMECLTFGCSGKSQDQINEWFNRRASDARAALKP